PIGVQLLKHRAVVEVYRKRADHGAVVLQGLKGDPVGACRQCKPKAEHDRRYTREHARNRAARARAWVSTVQECAALVREPTPRTRSACAAQHHSKPHTSTAIGTIFTAACSE